MNLHSRHWLLLIILAAALLLVFTGGSSLWMPKPVPPVHASLAAPPAHATEMNADELNAEPQQSKVPEDGSLADEVKRIRKDRLACVADAGTADIFAGKSWYVPPPPPKPVPPPPPTAPPLPFTFVGSYQEPDGRQVFFLARGERLYTVSTGDVIEGTYQVGEAAAGQLGLTYLPLNIRQVMRIGEAS